MRTRIVSALIALAIALALGIAPHPARAELAPAEYEKQVGDLVQKIGEGFTSFAPLIDAFEKAPSQKASDKAFVGEYTIAIVKIALNSNLAFGLEPPDVYAASHVYVLRYAKNALDMTEMAASALQNKDASKVKQMAALALTAGKNIAKANEKLVLAKAGTAKPSGKATPAPTAAPVASADSVVLQGKGAQVVNFKWDKDLGVLHVTGNAGKRYFGIEGFDADGESTGQFVNTTDVYDGYRLMDVRDGQKTTRFQVQATGAWKIEILPLTAMPKLTVPGTLKGKGDTIFLLAGAKPDIAKITGNAASRYFGITSYSNSSDLLVNTTDPYEGSVVMDGEAVVIEVTATGEWSMTVEGK